jgi:pimeloyl-ACP methyl ester carboxylesterase
MDTVDVDGLRVAYEWAGRGPQLVLLHGYVGDGPSTWRHQIDELSRDLSIAQSPIGRVAASWSRRVTR